LDLVVAEEVDVFIAQQASGAYIFIRREVQAALAVMAFLVETQVNLILPPEMVVEQ
jgi:hypothetical protein